MQPVVGIDIAQDELVVAVYPPTATTTDRNTAKGHQQLIKQMRKLAPSRIEVQGPDGMTLEQIEVALNEEMQAEMTGTPVTFSDLNPEEDLMPVTFTATQSTGTSIWIEVDLQAGSHGLVCFFPDISDGIPHAFHGIYTVIEIAE